MSGVDCVKAMAHLDDYLKRELTPELMVEVREHLDRCRECFDLARFEESFLALIESRAGRVTCPEKLRDRIVALLKAEAKDS
jgi:anti-sigma factor (TIGR02949 family)